MRYRMELMNADGVVVWRQVGTVHNDGNWTFDIETISREVGERIYRVAIYWGADADRF